MKIHYACLLGLPVGAVGKNPACQCRGHPSLISLGGSHMLPEQLANTAVGHAPRSQEPQPLGPHAAATEPAPRACDHASRCRNEKVYTL